ncbi:1A family penicillin-binding protein [Aliiruegeria haliotis]|uniref:peptidoglycan glycosyltransferase n=1 Tax=Aliiruegeria haliotis TaxID=1280846 RepID=A0A2T0RTM6_9RHOB|nr:PBP1A family penicillin-binding protein [Aliiruegeria haliotis]PRY24460.1 1A family penicillin-binding protein [Aliiruegeria haliotis]
MSASGGKRPTLRADKRYSKAPAKGKSARAKPKPTKAQSKAKSKPKAKATAARRSRKSASRKTRQRRGPLGWLRRLIGFVLGLIWSIAWRTAAVVGLILAGAVLYFYADLPEFTELIDGRTRGSVTLLDREGEVYAWRGEQFDSITHIEQVSPHLKNAVVAAEDKRFYWHLGVSPRGVASAIRINLSEGRSALSGHGGSTLTQQTAKLLCIGIPYDPSTGQTEAEYEADCRRGSIWRKAKEAIYAMALELKYTKDEILVIYFNRAYLGASARGFEAAAQRYFGIPAVQLSPAQAAMLAGLLPAPTRYAPTNNLKRSQDRADTVVRLMYDQGYLNESQRDQAWANPATLSEAAQARAGGYFADWVMDTGPNFLTRDTTEDVILHTTLDQDIQTSAEEAMKFIFQEKVKEGSKAQAAIVVMSADGAVRAMVGGRETKVSGAFNRATMAKRQTGSSFKPFVYAAAMDLGYTPLATVVDEPYCIALPGQPNYCPKNYSREFKGRVTLAKALADSLNIPAVKVSEAVGRENVRTIATDFGIDNELAVGPALALGVSESTLLEMTGAYAGILNGGRSVKPYGLIDLRLQGEQDSLMGQGGGYGERVISDEAARNLVYMMHQVVEVGTGQRAKLGDRPAAGKTGTTQAARDAWFIGFTADYVAGVWMGYDDNTPLSGVTGGGLPAEIWNEAMVRIHDGRPVMPLPMNQPQAGRPIAQGGGQGGQQTAPRYDGNTSTAQSSNQQKPRKDNLAERVLQDVLGNLFGRKN